MSDQPTRRIVAPDLPRTLAEAGVDPIVARRRLRKALCRSISTHRSCCAWTVDHAGWVVMRYPPDRQLFFGRILEEALAWYLVWLMAREVGVGPFTVNADQPTPPDAPPAPPVFVEQPFALG